MGQDTGKHPKEMTCVFKRSILGGFVKLIIVVLLQ